MNKILIVEDDKDIADIVSRFFQANEFSTAIIHDGKDVLEKVKSYQPNLIVLDIALPSKDGLSCCQDIRKFSNVPIIMLTAKTDEIDKMSGFEKGADDYICKPFSAPEVVLRAKNILKRFSAKAEIKTGGWQINELNNTVCFQNIFIELTDCEFKIFKLLYLSAKQVFSREEILKLVFDDNKEVSDRAIDSHIKNIRKRLKKDGISQTIIESVYGAGYRFVH